MPLDLLSQQWDSSCSQQRRSCHPKLSCRAGKTVGVAGWVEMTRDEEPVGLETTRDKAAGLLSSRSQHNGHHCGTSQCIHSQASEFDLLTMTITLLTMAGGTSQFSPGTEWTVSSPGQTETAARKLQTSPSDATNTTTHTNFFFIDLNITHPISSLVSLC